MCVCVYVYTFSCVFDVVKVRWEGCVSGIQEGS